MAETTSKGGARDAAPIPVLIAGGGPVGLALAIELGHRGVRCVLAEKRDGKVAVPKMSQVSARNMEFCRRWGIAAEVRGAAWCDTHPFDFVYMTALRGRELARQKVPSYAERGDLPYSPEGSVHCPQIYFDPILAAHAETLPSVTLRYNTAVDSFEQDDDIVRVRLSDSLTGRTETVSARYLVGCDGPNGTVREGLGIPLGGLGAIAYSINIFFRSPALATMHDLGWARFYRVVDAERCWSELIPIDGRELWRLTVFDDKSPEIDAGAYLRKLMGCDFPFEPVSVMRWERRDFVAEGYGSGRVFIAGDAAHECSPTGGLGMHTGIEEAVNLAWKLQAALEGWSGPGLLATYETERRPIARRNVGLATQAYQTIFGIEGSAALAEESPEGDRLRRIFVERYKELHRFSVPEHLKAHYAYTESPIVVDDGSPMPDQNPARYVPTARPGARVPHLWLEPHRSTLDVCGDGFVLLCLGPAAPDAAPLVAAAKGRIPLRVESLADPALVEAFGARLVLVRPDQHIAWRGDALPRDATALVDRVRGALTEPADAVQ